MGSTFSTLDIIVFVAFVVTVVTIGLLKSRKEKTSEDYFLAGRGLSWWLIGLSLIAANISTEQFVGMSGNAASHVGLAIASYEWMAAITLVVVAFCFLPYFLRAGIFTMPEFLEYRYDKWSGTIMAVATIGIYMLLLGAITYSGALTIRTMAANMGYDVSLALGALVIGLIAMLYVAAGGLKACAWADLIQGSALIVGGAIVMFFAFRHLGLATEAARVVDVNTGAVAIQPLTEGTGAIARFWELNKVRMNMFLPATDSVLPWTALMLGLWIPNFYYWGLNQYITQRTLGSSSLKQGQEGIVFAAFLKLLIPFVIVVPGIIAFNLYSTDMRISSHADNAPVLAKYVKANPSTTIVKVVNSPDKQTASACKEGTYMLAVYKNDDEVKALDVKNVSVLPISKEKYDSMQPAPYSVFKSDDQAWKFVNPALGDEIKAYNAKTEAAAAAAGAGVATEKLIAYKYDTALAQLLGNVLPQGSGLVGLVLAALLGAVVSSLAAMLNAASTIFTMDIYKKYIAPKASQSAMVLLGRICVFVFAIVAVTLAPRLGNPKISNSIFTIIQEGQGFISPGILAVFVFGLVIRRAPAICGVVGLLTNVVVYGLLKFLAPQIQFLNRMAICFGLCLAVMTIITIIKPLKEPVKFKKNVDMDLHSSKTALYLGIGVVVATLVLYFLFSPIGLLGK